MLNINQNLNFVILFTEFRFSNLKTTVSTITNNFDNPSYLCVVPKNSSKENLKTTKAICPVVEAGATVSSLINTGVKKSKQPWNLIVIAGNVIRYNPLLKYQKFVTSDKDILYRVLDKTCWRWDDASIHGILMHRDAVKEIGDFPEDEENLQSCKLLWGGRAIEKGYQFKGLVGVRLL